MLPSLLIAAATVTPGAPIPRDAVPNTTGPAPRVVAVKADGNGAVWITAQVWEKRKVQQQFFVVQNGKQVMKQQEVEQNISNYIHKTLGDFGGKFMMADGTALSVEDATRRLKDGATLLVTADGKPIDKGWLRAVAGDTVIMQAEGLGRAHFQYNAYSPDTSSLATTAAPRLAMLCADTTGSIRVAVNSQAGNQYGNQVYYDDLRGGRRIIRGNAVVMQGGLVNGSYYSPSAGSPPASDGKKSLADVKFDAYDLNGKLVPKVEALNRLRAGGLVLLAGDTKFPDPNYLKAFRDDILILVSGEFVFPAGASNPYDIPAKSTASPPGPGKPAPAPPVAVPAVRVVGVAAPAIQLNVAPAVVQVAPAAPAPPAPAPKAAKAAEKPAAKPKETPAKPATKQN